MILSLFSLDSTGRGERRDPNRLGVLLYDVYYESSSSVLITGFHLQPSPHYRRGQRKSREGRLQFGTNGSFMYSRREENTHFLFYCFKQMCYTGSGNGKYKHSRPGGRGWRGGASLCCTVDGWPDVSLLLPEGAWSELEQPGPRAALLLVAGCGPLGRWLMRRLLGLQNLSRIPSL